MKIKINPVEKLMHEILDENGGSMYAKELLRQVNRRLPAYIKKLKKQAKLRKKNGTV